MHKIGKSQVHDFICERLPIALRKDLRAFKLVREADVECAAYMHLRRFLDRDSSWRVLARRHVPHTGRYVDLMLFQGKLPRIAIEIKWARRTLNEKDRKSLGDAITKLGVNKAYWLTASVMGAEANPIAKQPHEKYSLHQICVRADLNEEETERWKEVRDSLRSEMRTGTGQKLRKRKVLKKGA